MIIDSVHFSGACSCGRSHTMETKLAVVEAGCLRQFDDYRQQFGLKGFCTAVYDRNTYRATAGVRPAADREIVLDPHHLHANEGGVALVLEQLPEETKLLVAVGAGTVHDLTRYCAWKRGIPFISCPTAASVDGFCSSVAAMTWEGAKKTLTAVPPVLVLADPGVFAKAPIRLARSGFGDMIGKYIALADWEMAHILTGEFHCSRIAQITAEATQAVLDCAAGIAAGEETAFVRLMYGLLLSVLAMQMMGNSRPASGAEHHISHLIEMEPAGLPLHSEALHGEKVGVGTLLACREYHRLAALPERSWRDYRPVAEEEIQSVFGPTLGRQLREENARDAADGVTGERIRACLPQLREVISRIPTPQTLEAVYQTVGANAVPEDISVDPVLCPQLLDASPLVRNRLTLMRLRRCL